MVSANVGGTPPTHGSVWSPGDPLSPTADTSSVTRSGFPAAPESCDRTAGLGVCGTMEPASATTSL